MEVQTFRRKCVGWLKAAVVQYTVSFEGGMIICFINETVIGDGCFFNECGHNAVNPTHFYTARPDSLS